MIEPPSPILRHKAPDEPSLFVPEALLREARRQKHLPDLPVPGVCVLDPDGDIVRHLLGAGQARRFEAWPCYHSEMYAFTLESCEVGIVGCAVGAPYAVLVAEQMFAAGCKLLISVTSAGQIAQIGPTPYFVVIDRALRDEGTSHHYLPPSNFVEASADLVTQAVEALSSTGSSFHVGATWTTDAPFRETRGAIQAAHGEGVLAVEMEAAALYAFAQARQRPVLCLAHVTNTMAQAGDDFEKGADNGACEVLTVLAALARTLRSPSDPCQTLATKGSCCHAPVPP
jgi:uridine phosphorylase